MVICEELNIEVDYILFGVSLNRVETSLHDYLKQLTQE